MIQAFHYTVTCTNMICFPSSVWTEEYDTVFNNSCTYHMTTWGGMRPFWWPIRRPINVSDKVSNQWNMKLPMQYNGLAALPKRLSSTKAMPWMYWPITQNQYFVKKKKKKKKVTLSHRFKTSWDPMIKHILDIVTTPRVVLIIYQPWIIKAHASFELYLSEGQFGISVMVEALGCNCWRRHLICLIAK